MKLFITAAVLALVSMPAGAKEIVQTISAPNGEISGLAWGGNTLWCVDATADTVYSLDPSTGDVVSSFHVDNIYTGYYPTGLGYSETYSMVLVGTWNGGTTGYVYKFLTNGSFVGYVNMCGG